MYRKLVADGTLPGGLACDDGAAAHYIDDTLAELVTDHPGASAYRVMTDGRGGAREEHLPTSYLGA